MARRDARHDRVWEEASASAQEPMLAAQLERSLGARTDSRLACIRSWSGRSPTLAARVSAGSSVLGMAVASCNRQGSGNNALAQ